MIDGSSNKEIENAANRRQEKSLFDKITTEKQEKRAYIGALNKNTEKNGETENKSEWSCDEHEIRNNFMEHGTTPTKNTPVSDCTNMTCVEKQHCIKNEYKSGYVFSDSYSGKTWNSETVAQRKGTNFRGNEIEGDIIKNTKRDVKYFLDNGELQLIPASKISIDSSDCNNSGVIPFLDSDEFLDCNKIRNERTEQDVTDCEMKIRPPKEFETAVRDDNQIKPKYNNSGSKSETNYQTSESDHEVGKDFVQNCCSSPSTPQKICDADLIRECETPKITDRTQYSMIEHFSTESKVFTEEANRRKEISPVEDKVFIEGKYGRKEVLPMEDKVLTKEANRRGEVLPVKNKLLTEEANSRKDVQPAEDEVLTDAENGREKVLPVQEEVCTKKTNRKKEVSSVEEGMFTDGTNERKQVLPVRIGSHKESPDKGIIALQRKGKSITLLLTDCQPNVQVLQRMSKTMSTQTISTAACTKDLDLIQQDFKKGKMGYFPQPTHFLPIFLSHIWMFQNFHSGIVKSKSEAAEKMKIDLFNTEKKQYQSLSYIFVDLNERLSIFRTPSLFSLFDSFVLSEKNKINLGEAWKAWRDLVLQNEFIWPHWRMVKTSDTFQINWLTELYDETRSSVYNYKFSFLFFGQFRLTLSHWQDLVKKNVLSPNKNCNRNNHPTNSTMSLIFLHNADPGPCQRFNSQSRLQTGIIKTSLHFDANKKSKGNAMSKPPVLQAMENMVDNDVVMKYVSYCTLKNYDRKNVTEPNCKTSEIPFFNENTLKKKPKRIAKTLSDFDANKKNALSKAAVAAGSVWLEYRAEADTESDKYDRQNGTQLDRKTFDDRPLNKNTLTKNSELVKLCTVSEANDEARCMLRLMKNEGSYFIYLNSIAINKQVPASKTTCAKLDSAPNIHQRDYVYCTGGSNDLPVERYDEESSKWRFVEPTPRLVKKASAAVVNSRIYVADYKGVLCYDIQKDSCSEMNLSYQWHFVKGGQVKILAVNEKLYIIKNESVFKTAMYLLRPEAGQMTPEKGVKDTAFFINNFLAVPEKRPTAEEVLNETQQFDLRFSILDSKKEKLLDTYLNEVDVITGTEKSGPFLKNKAVPIKGGRRSVVRERREVIAINKQVTASKLTCAELEPAPNIYPEDSKKVKLQDTYLNEVDVITGTEKSKPFLKIKAAPIQDETYARRGVVRERREVGPTTRLDPYQGVIREWKVDKKAFNDNPTMNT